MPVVQAWGGDTVWDVGNYSRKVLMSMSLEHDLRVVGRNLCPASFKTMGDRIQAFYKNGGWGGGSMLRMVLYMGSTFLTFEI